MELYERIIRTAASSCTVMVVGGSGTARNLVARILYHNGASNGAFTSLDCASVSQRLINNRLAEAADGMVFLDEVAYLHAESQEILLRVHDTREHHLRIVSGTSQDIAAMVRDGQFREDLYYRLNVVILDLRDYPEGGTVEGR